MTDTYRTPAPQLVRPYKHMPLGLGLWTAFEQSIDPGLKVRDLAVALDRLDRAGASWTAPRAGAGSANDVAFNEVSAKAYLDNGKKLYPWIFPYRGTEAKVVAGFRRYFVAGAHGCIINAEFEYQPATAAEARALVRLIRTAWAEAQGERDRMGLEVVADEPFIAHAPPDYLGAGVGHALSDELVALDEECDAIMPQVYAYEHDDRGHAFHVERVAKGYESRGIHLAKVWWVGCTYRPAERGGKKLAPLPPQVIADDVMAFLDHPLVRACPAPSLYSLDAISWINGPSDRVMAALEVRARGLGAQTIPAPGPTRRDTPSALKAVTVEIMPTPKSIPLFERIEAEHTPHLHDDDGEEPPPEAA